MIIYIDIEAVPQHADHASMDERGQNLWNKFAERFLKNPKFVSVMHSYEDKAALYAEFGKIVCISVGYVTDDGFRMKSYTDEDEAWLLSAFIEDMKKMRSIQFCGHNIKGYDLPFICRRMMAHNTPIPHWIDTAGKKPWEIIHIDTAELWRFGNFKDNVSLDRLTYHLGLPSPKDKIDGSMVAAVYYGTGDYANMTKEDRIKMISDYCEKDIMQLPDILERFGQPTK